MIETSSRSGLFDRLKTNIQSGWNRLMNSRVGIMTENVIATASVVSENVANGIRSTRDGVREAYNEVDGNILQRMGNVIRTGVENIQNRFNTLRETVTPMIEDIRSRARGLGLVGQAINAALDARDQIGIFANMAKSMFEEKKLDNIQTRVDNGIVESDERYPVISRAYDVVEKKKEEFSKRAAFHMRRYQNMVDLTAGLIAAKNAGLTVATVAA
jgi:hypothetical protein